MRPGRFIDRCGDALSQESGFAQGQFLQRPLPGPPFSRGANMLMRVK